MVDLDSQNFKVERLVQYSGIEAYHLISTSHLGHLAEHVPSLSLVRSRR